MNDLESLRHSGWSFIVGYSWDFRSYYARAWKDRPKPVCLKSPGGGDVNVYLWCVSAIGKSIEDAATKCAALAIAEAGDGAWWNGLPVKEVK